MKNILSIFAAAVAVSLSVFAGYNDIKPAETKSASLTAVEWSYTNDTVLAEATAEDVLADFVADASAAEKLLARIGGAYAGDAVTLCQIAAVSQWVMGPEPCWLRFWRPSPSAGREIWVAALLKTFETSGDDYVKTFCLDQLRWCGYSCTARRIGELANGEKSKAVRDFAALVIRELEVVRE